MINDINRFIIKCLCVKVNISYNIRKTNVCHFLDKLEKSHI